MKNLTTEQALNTLEKNGIFVEKSDHKEFDWYVPNKELDEVGVHLTNTDLINFSNEIEK